MFLKFNIKYVEKVKIIPTVKNNLKFLLFSTNNRGYGIREYLFIKLIRE